MNRSTFSINGDGTVSPANNTDIVLGYGPCYMHDQGGRQHMIFVRRGSPQQFVFDSLNGISQRAARHPVGGFTFKTDLAGRHKGKALVVKDSCCCPIVPLAPCCVLCAPMCCFAGVSLGEPHDAFEVTWNDTKQLRRSTPCLPQYFDVAWGNHVVGDEVRTLRCGLCYEWWAENINEFQLCTDGTIADKVNPNLVYGLDDKDRVVLVERSDLDHVLIFQHTAKAPGVVQVEGAPPQAQMTTVCDAILQTDVLDPAQAQVIIEYPSAVCTDGSHCIRN